SLFAHHLAAADRAMFGHAKSNSIATFLHNANDFGNHVAAALEKNAIVELHAEPCDLVLVVQSRVADRGPTPLGRIRLCHWCQSPRPADLHADVQQPGCRLTGAKLDGECPARRFCSTAELFLKFDGIDLDDHSVDFVVEVVAVFFPMATEIHNFTQ